MRPLSFFAAALATIVTTILGLWFFAYELSPAPVARITLPDMEADAVVRVFEDGVVSIEASGTLDVYRALGFAQGSERPWASLILRQAALARLSTWFGDEGVVVDGHVATLRLARTAQSAYADLDAEAQSRLQAFAHGMNAALQQDRVARLDPVVVLRADIQPWEPWHTLAIERLFAWLTMDVDDESVTGEEYRTFMDVQASLQNSFYLAGFDRSAAWAFRRNDVTYFHYRLVHGRSALPFFLDVSIASPAMPRLSGLAIAGTPFFLAGRTDDEAWGIIPISTARVEPSTSWRPDGARVAIATVTLGSIASGRWTRSVVDERVVPFRVDPRGYQVFAENDSAFVRLRWPGFTDVTDARAFHALMVGDEPVFRLQDGIMLNVARSGVWTADAAGDWQRRFSGGVLVERSPWTPYHVARLNDLVRSTDSLATSQWSSDTFSPWAATVVPILLDAVAADSARSDSSTSVSDGPLTGAAITYLRNWDFTFGPASIAGSVFDEWATTYARRTGRFASVEALQSDSLLVEHTEDAMRLAVATLQRRFGPDVSNWRWERAQETIRPFPFWTYFSGSRGWFGETRYSAKQPVGVGHPSTLDWGATSAQGGDPPASWDILLQTDTWDTWTIQRAYPAHQVVRNFEDAMADFESSEATAPSSAALVQTTTLRPPS